jgi:hypothetical protein
MDANSSFNLEIRIVSPRCHDGGWFSLDKVVDANVTNFRDLVDGVVDKYPCDYVDIIRMFYFCMDTKVNIEVCNDHDVLDMFGKHKASKCCLLTLSYHSPSVEPPEIPGWDSSSIVPSVQPPMTPSVAFPSLVGSSHATHTEHGEPNLLANPNPMNEFVCIDEEGLYIDLGPQHPLPPPSSQCQGGNNNEFVGSDACSESDDDSMYGEDDSEVEDIDDIVKDREDELMPDVDYDKNDPPMTEGTVYPNMDAFKIALASHAVKYEFNYDIEKSDPGRYRVSCSFKSEGCRWRIHAATLPDGVRVKVIINSTIYLLYS